MLRTSGPPSTAFRTALRRALLLAVAASATVFRASAQEAAEPSTVTVTGTVVSDATGDPIAEVIVLAEQLGLTFVTDAQGQFVFEEVPRGVYAIDLIHKDYERLEGDLSIDQPGSFVLAMTPTSGPGAGFMTGVVGLVTDQASGDPIADVVVSVPLAGRVTRTGANGRFRVAEMVAGRQEIRFSHLGYVERTESVDIQMGRVTTVRVALDVNAIALDPIEVTVDRRDATLEDRGFYQREEDGWGYFVDREDLEARNPIELTDALNRFPGVRIVSDPGGGQRHLRIRSFGDECLPVIFIDGVRMIGRGGYSINDMVDPSVVAGVEVYRGVAGTPPQYWVSSCGVVLIWLRRGESRAR
ncbi:MAG: TonB-dependent receptor plug domain-containing protein [Gemmatimonadetes bacterium]|nr:carboxypeptidase regulatory-like domain-containing protein [Gemmatimonadota bacterium]MYA42920.1 TonB-dependent receptor plug domain-containing protein [Gemmatimonadota bacterium]MYE93747.1 TonB-dependent receptor plug domain-containing protein [Gemmatimonadota bacterium]MYJ09418.1 TonB-dependent receptor plug domain-containing protein [Gemmatimonadota bacterium]